MHPHPPADNVAVALCPIPAGTRLSLEGRAVQVREDIRRGHKAGARPDCRGRKHHQIRISHRARRFGYPARRMGAHHNVRTNLSGEVEYTYAPDVRPLSPVPPETFQGYRRADGRRRPQRTDHSHRRLRERLRQGLGRGEPDLVSGSIDGLYAFPHPFGCSQTGADHAQTRRLLAALARHPNAGGVLVLSLGCENLTHEQFAEELGPL